MQVSKLRLAPYWLVPVRPLWAQRGLPSAGQRLVTLTTMLLPAFETALPELSVSLHHQKHQCGFLWSEMVGTVKRTL